MNSPEVRQAGVRDVAFGARVKIVEPCNLYGCKIGDDCFVGPFVEIQKGAVVGARALVTRDVAAATLVGGVPARVLRHNVRWSRARPGADG